MEIDGIYAAIEDDQVLGTLAATVARLCGTRSALVQFANRQSGFQLAQMNYWTPTDFGRYFTEFQLDDPWKAAAVATRLSATPIALDALLPPSEFSKTVMFNELFRPIGDDTGRALAVLSGTDGDGMIVSVHRSINDRPFSASDAERISEVYRHLKTVLRCRAIIASEKREQVTLQSMVDASGRAIIVVDEYLAIRRASVTAIRLLDRCDGLSCKTRRLQIEDRIADGMVRRAVREAIDRRPLTRAAIVCHRPSGGTPFNLVILAPTPERRGGVMILLAGEDRPKNSVSRSRWLRDLYDCTVAEAAVAEALLSGLSLSKIADLRGVTKETVRTQLRTLFAKTATSRQSELVALVCQLPE